MPNNNYYCYSDEYKFRISHVGIVKFCLVYPIGGVGSFSLILRLQIFSISNT